jgi:mRNA interferase RelE/StbE
VEVILKASLVKDLQRVTSSALRGKIRTLIEQLEQVQSLQSIRHLKKVQSGKNCYRIRVGDYRLGLVVEGPMVILVRFLPRDEIYKHFP